MGLSLAQHLQGLRLYQRACLVTAEDGVLREVLWAAPEVHKKSVHIHYYYGPYWCLRTEPPLRAFIPHTWGILYFPGQTLQKPPLRVKLKHL